MRANTPNERSSSWPAHPKILISLFLLVIFLGGAPGIAFAEATLTVKLPKLPRTVKPILISVRAVEAETSKLLASVSLNKKSNQVQLKVEAVPQIVFFNSLTSDGNTPSWHSHVLRPVDRKKLTVTPQLESQPSAALSEMNQLPLQSSSPSAGTPWPPVGTVLLGVPASGFTASGVDLSARNLADMATTDLTQTSCYGQTGGFSLVETDPDRLAAINAEIDLSNSTWADPSTRLQNRYVPPTYFVNGSWTSDGSNLTITMRLVDAQGTELLSKSATGPADSFSDLNSRVAKELAADMCCDPEKIDCAKTGSIDINFAFEQSNELCACRFSEIGSIQFGLQSVIADPNNACEYLGEGTASFGIDCSICSCSTICTVAIGAAGKVASQSGFPCTGPTLMFNFSNTYNCSSLCWGSTTIPENEVFPYQDGAIVSWPGIQGGYTLHLD